MQSRRGRGLARRQFRTTYKAKRADDRISGAARLPVRLGEIRRSLLRLDPLSPIVDSVEEFLYFACRNDEAIEQFSKALEMDPRLDPLRTDARFSDLLGPLGFAAEH